MSLSLRSVGKRFGGLRAVHDVTFEVGEGLIFGLIGPNGAGKTTLFNLVTGIYTCDEGQISFDKTDLTHLRPAQIAAAGVARTFQNIRLFGQLTVLENLLVAGDAREARRRSGILTAIFESPASLPYGHQRRLEIARAMMLSPKLLLLDEPAAGMNYGEAEGLLTQLRWLRDTFGLTVVLVEHNMQVVMGASDEIHVLDRGETLAHGTPAEIRKHPKVLAAYLGDA